MSDLSVLQIIADLNRVRSEDFPLARAQPTAASVEALGAKAIAALAMVERWEGSELDKKLGEKTARQLIADGAGVSSSSLTDILTELATTGFIDIRKRPGFLTSKVEVSWSAAGRNKCYAYLNRWGWELLSIALEARTHQGFRTGPPIVGGPGHGGWSSSDK